MRNIYHEYKKNNNNINSSLEHIYNGIDNINVKIDYTTQTVYYN